MDFEIIGKITNIKVIAVGRAIRDLARLRKRYSKGRWRKLKGIATVRLKGKHQFHFAVCINNKSYEASLETGKLYRVIPNEKAASHGYIRVIDES